MPDFFGCYLLQSRSMPLKTYVGFTVNPIQRIRQHNGEIANGAQRTKTGRPWDMLMVVYGFCNKKHALQFEWALQHPAKSLATKEICAALKKKRLSGAKAHVKFVAEMLNVNPWRMYPLTVQLLHEKCEDYWKDTRPLPSHIRRVTLPPEALPLPTGGAQQDDDDDDEHADLSSDGSSDADSSPASSLLPSQPLSAAAHVPAGHVSAQRNGSKGRRGNTHRGRRMAPALCGSHELAAIDSLYADQEGDTVGSQMAAGSPAKGGSVGACSMLDADETQSDVEGSDEGHAVGGPAGAQAQVQHTKDGILEASPGKCSECNKPLLKNFFPCPGCSRHFHDECWAPYLRRDEQGDLLPSSTLMPGHGDCPECSAAVSWPQVLQGSLAVKQHNRHGKKGRRGRKEKAPRKPASDSAPDIGTASTRGRGQARGRGRGRGRASQQTDAEAVPLSTGATSVAAGASQRGTGRRVATGGRRARGAADAEATQDTARRNCSTLATACSAPCVIDEESSHVATSGACAAPQGECPPVPVSSALGDVSAASMQQEATQATRSGPQQRAHGHLGEAGAAEDEKGRSLASAHGAAPQHPPRRRNRKLFDSLLGSQDNAMSIDLFSDDEGSAGESVAAAGASARRTADAVCGGGRHRFAAADLCEPASFQPSAAEAEVATSGDAGGMHAEPVAHAPAWLDHHLDSSPSTPSAVVRSVWLRQCKGGDPSYNAENDVPGFNIVRDSDNRQAALCTAAQEATAAELELPPTPMSFQWTPEPQLTGVEDIAAGVGDVCMQNTTPIAAAGFGHQTSPRRGQVQPVLSSVQQLPAIEDPARGLSCDWIHLELGDKHHAQLQARGGGQCTASEHRLHDVTLESPPGAACCADEEMSFQSPSQCMKHGPTGDLGCRDRKGEAAMHTPQHIQESPSSVIDLMT